LFRLACSLQNYYTYAIERRKYISG
jgi:hypothetical protein